MFSVRIASVMRLIEFYGENVTKRHVFRTEN